MPKSSKTRLVPEVDTPIDEIEHNYPKGVPQVTTQPLEIQTSVTPDEAGPFISEEDLRTIRGEDTPFIGEN